jgi:hypothetical protein
VDTGKPLERFWGLSNGQNRFQSNRGYTHYYLRFSHHAFGMANSPIRRSNTCTAHTPAEPLNADFMDFGPIDVTVAELDAIERLLGANLTALLNS